MYGESGLEGGSRVHGFCLCEVGDGYWYVGALSPFCGMHIEHPTLCSPHSLDQLLDAGLYTGEVTELAGAPGSGKTQVSGAGGDLAWGRGHRRLSLCHEWAADDWSILLQVCLSIAASVSLGLRQHVVFLDSTGGFTASRLYQMLQSHVEDKEEQVSSVFFLLVWASAHHYPHGLCWAHSY